MDASRPVTNNRLSRGELILGLLPFVLLCAGVALLEAPFMRGVRSGLTVAVGIYGFFVTYLLILAVLLYAWIKEFPRWSMPYLGYGLVFSVYMIFVATPGLELFGIPMWGRELWGLRACVPVALIALLGSLVSRPPWKPLAALIRKTWNDWTHFAFVLYGFLPLILLLSQDEMDHAYSFWPTVIALTIVLAGAGLYLTYARKPYRAAFLLGATFLSVLAVSVGSNFYWKTHDVNMRTFEVTPLPGPAPWAQIIAAALTAAFGWTLFLAAPALVGLIHRLVSRNNGTAPISE